MSGAVLMKDPFTYSASQGGGKIVQRFGTPQMPQGGSGAGGDPRYFGIEQDATSYIPMGSGVHNLWYQRYGTQETLTMFANGVSSDFFSHAYEFDVNLVDEDTAVEKSDAVFATKYQTGRFTFNAQAQGGVRPLGKGVWIGASGAGSVGLQIIDASGKFKTLSSKALLYDPFCRVVVTDDDAVVV